MMKGTKEYNWMKHQSSSGPACSDAKIKKEIELNEGGTVLRDRKAKMDGCIATK